MQRGSRTSSGQPQADTVEGNARDNVLTGLAGDDTLAGGAGDDTFTGGAGDDRFDGGLGTDTVVESGNVDFTLTPTTLTGLGTDTLAGIESAALTAGSGANTFTLSRLTGKRDPLGCRRERRLRLHRGRVSERDNCRSG